MSHCFCFGVTEEREGERREGGRRRSHLRRFVAELGQLSAGTQGIWLPSDDLLRSQDPACEIQRAGLMV